MKEQYDLVLMDIGMFILDGYEASKCQKIRKPSSDRNHDCFTQTQIPRGSNYFTRRIKKVLGY